MPRYSAGNIGEHVLIFLQAECDTADCRSKVLMQNHSSAQLPFTCQDNTALFGLRVMIWRCRV